MKNETSRKLQTTGDLRTFLANVALAVSQGDMKPQDAAIAVKACKELNASLYSELKNRTIQLEAAPGVEVPALGDLLIGGGNKR
jgi:hypothetical protein